MSEKTVINVSAMVKAPIEKVWKCWTSPEDIIKWNHASDDWHTTRAANDLKIGGKFTSRMEAKDGSFGFDFEGVYTDVKQNELIAYVMEDGRQVTIHFMALEGQLEVMEAFDAETENSIELQKNGWQAIMDNFKNYVEAL